MMTDSEVMQYTGFKKPQPEERIRELLAHWILEGETELGVWAAVESDSKKFIGWFMLKLRETPDPELGFMIVKDYWNQGFATETAQGLLNYAESKLKLKRIVATISPQNLPSAKVLEKIGMTKCKEQPLGNATMNFEWLSSK